MARNSYRRERETVSNPSFSSSLLDSIYRSIDQGEDEEVETLRKKQQTASSLKEKRNLGLNDEEKSANFERLRMIEKWMEKESEKVDGRRRSVSGFVPKAVKENNPEALFSNSSWSSSDSSRGCWFSSSEVEESVFGVSRNRSSSSSSCYVMPKHKPIKTSLSIQQEKPRHEDGRRGGFEKTKSRALKIYGDLKKSKQPISPGGKLATFLNSLFTSGHAKKPEIEAMTSKTKMINSANASTCSSVSSFSKSCLSKTPTSSRDGKSSSGTKRSVRFYPVSVIVDEHCQPCGHKNLYNDEKTYLVDSIIRCSIKDELKNQIMEKNQRVEEAAKDLLRSYQKRVELEHGLRSSNHVKNQIFTDDDENEEEDDAASCGSSDLFELDNLSGIGMERYTEELPVYETTHLHTNRAIAKGIIIM